jgi:hypothetical protein
MMESYRETSESLFKRREAESVVKLVTKKQKIMTALVDEGQTEKAILQKVGDNRYSREIIRNLLQAGLICRNGKVRNCSRILETCQKNMKIGFLRVTRISQGGAKNPYRFAADLSVLSVWCSSHV